MAALLCIILVSIYYNLTYNYKASQQTLAQTHSFEIADQISYILEENQRHVQLFAEDHQQQLRRLRKDTDNDELKAELENALKRIFPNYFAFTLTNKQGEPLIDDFDGFISELCIQDIKDYAKNKQYLARIHPNNFRYHFDSIAQWYDEKNEVYFLMVSFEPNTFGKHLQTTLSNTYEAIIISNTAPMLLEMTKIGARNKTLRNDYRLSATEKSHILSKHPVKHSRWEVAIIDTKGNLEKYRQQILIYILAILLAFILITGLFLCMLNIEEKRRRKLEQEREHLIKDISQMAFYDPLTNLPNRRLLNERLNQVNMASSRHRYYCALLFIDLDHFKQLNDTYGHGTGDLLLIEVAKRLKGCVRQMDTVARLGGDEFIILLNELDKNKTASTPLANNIAEKIRISLAEPFYLSINKKTNIEYKCSSSIGIVVFCNDDIDNENIFKCADTAMYQAKQDGRNLIRFYKDKH